LQSSGSDAFPNLYSHIDRDDEQPLDHCLDLLANAERTVTLDRNRYFMLGVVLFLLGIQFRMVDSFVLNEGSTRALQRIAKQAKVADANNAATNAFMQASPSPKKTFKHPPWLGFVLLTVGGVMSLHAMVLPKP